MLKPTHEALRDNAERPQSDKHLLADGPGFGGDGGGAAGPMELAELSAPLQVFKTEASLWRYMAELRKRFDMRFWDLGDRRIYALSLTIPNSYSGPTARVAFDNKETGQRLAYEVLDIKFEKWAPDWGFILLGRRLYDIEVYGVSPGLCEGCAKASLTFPPNCSAHTVLCGSMLQIGGFCPQPAGHVEHASARRRHA